MMYVVTAATVAMLMANLLLVWYLARARKLASAATSRTSAKTYMSCTDTRLSRLVHARLPG